MVLTGAEVEREKPPTCNSGTRLSNTVQQELITLASLCANRQNLPMGAVDTKETEATK